MISLRLPWPPSNNRYWRHVGSKVLISEQGRHYRDLVWWAVRKGRPAKAVGRLAVSILAHVPDKRTRDLDNLPKAILDALTTAGVWADDSQIDDLHVRRGTLVKGGAIEIEVREIA